MRNGLKMSFMLVLATSLLLSACSKSNNASSGSSESASPSSSPSESANASASPDTPAAFQLGTEPVDFSFYAHYDWYVTDPWGTDPTTEWVKENLKVNLTPIQSGGAAQQKLNTMIVSDSLPDVIMIDRGVDYEKLRQAGKLVALDDYLDKYPNLKKYAGDQTLNLLRSEDGKLYGVPNWYTSTPNGNGAYLINKKIYKELGSPKLETFADLESYLQSIKTKYPGVVPLETDVNAGGIHLFDSGMEENFSTTYVNQRAVPRGDQLTSLFLDPTFNASIKYASKLFREKLITQDAFTQKSDQVYEKMKNGKVGVFVSGDALNSNIKDANNMLQQKDPIDGYMAIWPIHADGVAPDKVFPNYYESQGWNMIAITTKAKDPEKIFAYLDWVTGPAGQAVMQFGPKGRYWDEVDADGSPIPNDKWTSTPQTEKDKDKLGSFNFPGNTSFVDSTKAKIELNLPEEKRDWGTIQQTSVTWKTSQNMTIFTNLTPPADSPEGIAEGAVKTIFDDYVAKALFAKSDAEVDSILKSANDAANAQGYEKLLKFKTERWQANVKKAAGK